MRSRIMLIYYYFIIMPFKNVNILLLVYLLNVTFILSDSNNEPIKIELLHSSELYILSSSFGSDKQPISLIVDTLHTVLSVMSNRCHICKSNFSFNNETSSSFSIVNRSQSVISMNNEEFIGYLSTDSFHINDINIDNLTFFLVDNITHNTIFYDEGFLSLGFSKKNRSLLNILKENNVISEAIYSLLFKKNSDKGYFYLGGYDTQLINASLYSNFTFTHIEYSDDDYSEWYIPIHHIVFENKVTKYNVTSKQKIVLNSSINKILIPRDFFFEHINEIFLEESKCEIRRDNNFHCVCSSISSFPTFKFYYERADKNESFFKIAPEYYVTMDNSITETSDTVNCVLSINLNYKNEYWQFGTNVIENFYIIFNHENDTIGLLEFDTNGHYSEIMFLSLIIIACSLTFFMSVYLILKKCNHSNEHDENHLINDIDEIDFHRVN